MYERCVCSVLSAQGFLNEGERGALYTVNFPGAFAEVAWEGEWQSAQQACRRCLKSKAALSDSSGRGISLGKRNSKGHCSKDCEGFSFAAVQGMIKHVTAWRRMGKERKWPMQVGLSIKTLQSRSLLFGCPTDLRCGWFLVFAGLGRQALKSACCCSSRDCSACKGDS